MHAGHQTTKCKHGTLIASCRCMKPNKTIVIAPCPTRCVFSKPPTTPRYPPPGVKVGRGPGR